MLTDDNIISNRARFNNIINSLEREGIDKEKLLKYLNKGDFFTAPASTRYHNSFKGGLCAHCLNVYDNLLKLMQIKYPPAVAIQKNEQGEEVEVWENTCPYSHDTLAIVSLLHDFAKVNFYEPTVRNQKIYTATGSKKDEMGRFDWVAVPGYGVKDSADRFIYGNHEYTSLYMVSKFIPLSLEEEIAISHHHAGMSDDCAKDNVSAIMSKYPLALFLHLADMTAAYFDETTS